MSQRVCVECCLDPFPVFKLHAYIEKLEMVLGIKLFVWFIDRLWFVCVCVCVCVSEGVRGVGRGEGRCVSFICHVSGEE